MAVHQHAAINDTLYFWFGSNDTSGSGNDGASPLADVRLAGAAASAAPVLSPTPSLLSDAGYPAGCYEVAVAATTGNGFAAGNTYAVFCTLTVDSQNPTGFVGSFTLDPILANITEISDDATAATNAESFFDGTGYAGTGNTIPTVTNVTNQVTADVTAISGDTTAADNLELFYDGTGYNAANSTVGNVTLTATTTSVTNQVTADVTAISGDTPAADNAEAFFDGTGYAGTNNVIPTVTTVTTVSGLAANSVTASAMATDAVEEIADQVWDEVLTAATHNVANSAGRRLRAVQEYEGYELGAIWIDTVNGSAGTTAYENGTSTNPVNSIADANTLNSTLNLNRFHLAPNSSITLAATQSNQVFLGSNWTLALGGQSITNTTVYGATVSGTGTGSGAVFVDCFIGTSTLADCSLLECALTGTLTLSAAGDYYLNACYSGVAGTSAPIVDFGAAVANTNLNMRHYSGGIDVRNMGQSGTDNMSLEGYGNLIVNANCTGGTIVVRGMFTLSDSGSATITEVARVDINNIWAKTITEPTGPFAWSDSVLDILEVLGIAVRNRITQTSTTTTVYADDTTTPVMTSTTSDNGTIFTRTEFT